MSNAAVIKLQKKQIGAHHVWLDDNFGEAIHVHIGQICQTGSLHRCIRIFAMPSMN